MLLSDGVEDGDQGVLVGAEIGEEDGGERGDVAEGGEGGGGEGTGEWGEGGVEEEGLETRWRVSVFTCICHYPDGRSKLFSLLDSALSKRS